MAMRKAILLAIFSQLFLVLPASRAAIGAAFEQMGVVNSDGITDTVSARRHDAHEEYVDSSGPRLIVPRRQRKKKPKGGGAGGRPTSESLKVFHINLSWECMALPPFGSGHAASIHCLPGRFAGTRDAKDNIINWEWEVSEYAKPEGEANELSLPWTAGNEPWNSLVTSCSNTFIRSMEAWNQIGHDVITMSELANPGKQGMKFLGRDENTLPAEFLEKAEQQMDGVFYEFLSHNLFWNYGVFAHVVVKRNIAIQATYWNKDTLGEQPTLAVGIDSQQERPVSALFFQSKKVLVVNVHSALFRRELIHMFSKFGQDMVNLLAEIGKTDTKFRVEEFKTSELQSLFGSWIELKIKKALALCTVFGRPLAEQVFCSGEDQDAGLSFARDVLSGTVDLRNEKWSIYLAGDFNDSTGELSKFNIFGVKVTSGPRLRTCCSNLDKDFKKVENDMKNAGSYNTTQDELMPGKLGSWVTVSHFNAWKAGYFNTRQGLVQHVKRYMQLPGAIKFTKESPGRSQPSDYASPADMILSNVKGSDMQYPAGYAQRMFQMISDHDPIVRYFR